jgi:hypothetical protein
MGRKCLDFADTDVPTGGPEGKEMCCNRDLTVRHLADAEGRPACGSPTGRTTRFSLPTCWQCLQIWDPAADHDVKAPVKRIVLIDVSAPST